MDEQKIQLESKLDFDYIKSNFLSYMKGLKESKKFSMEDLETVQFTCPITHPFCSSRKRCLIS